MWKTLVKGGVLSLFGPGYVQAICGNTRAEMMEKRVKLSSIVQHATSKEVQAFFGCSEWLVRSARIHAEVSVQ